MTAYMFAALARLHARRALRQNFSTALLISFLSELPSLLAQVFGLLAVSPLLDELITRLYTGDTAYFRQMANWNVDDVLMRIDHTWALLAGICVLLTVFLPCLRLGALNSQLKLLRGEEISPADILSRLGTFFRAIGLTLWRSLWVFLWSLPGFGVSVLSALVSLNAQPGSFGASFGAQSLSFLALALTVVLVGWAEVRYFFSDCAMADDPTLGPVRAMRESRRIAKGNVSRVLFMLLAFVAWYLLRYLITGFLAGVVGQVLSLMLSAVLTLYISACTASLFCHLSAPEAEAPKTIRDDDGAVE